MGLRRRSFAFQSSSPSVEISSPVRIQSVGITGGGEGPSVGGTSDAAEAADANAAALDDEARRKVEIDATHGSKGTDHLIVLVVCL